jgi:hypothetical protein
VLPGAEALRPLLEALPPQHRGAAPLLEPLLEAARAQPAPADLPQLLSRAVELVAARLPPPAPAAGPAPEPAPKAELHAHAAALARLAPRVADWLATRPEAPLRGFVLRSAEADASGAARLQAVLERGSDRLALVLGPAGTFPAPFVETAHLAAVFRRDGPADTREKSLIARLFVQALERAAHPPR